MDVDPTHPKGFVELDFNDFFVKMLSENGYTGNSDEDIVNACPMTYVELFYSKN